jgi:F0F1-type ATP synthase assembly protein I
MQQLGKYLGLAFLLPCCTLVGFIIGHYLDKAFGTTFLTLVFLLFGIAAGFIEVFRELKPDNDGGR